LRLVGIAAVLGGIASCWFTLTALLFVGCSWANLGSIGRLAAVLFSALLVGVGVGGVWAMSLAVPLYRGLQRVLSRSHLQETPPPSIAAVRDTFEAPATMMASAGVMVGTVLVLEFLRLAQFGRFDERLGFGVLLHATSICLAFLYPLLLLWRRALWVWLDRLDPMDVPIKVRTRLAGGTLRRVLLLLVSMLLSFVAMLAAHNSMSEVKPMALLGISFSFVVLLTLTALFARRLGQLVADDVRRLSARMAVLLGSGLAGRRAGPSTHPFRTRAAAELSDGIQELVDKYGMLQREELRARSAVEEAQRLKSRFLAYMSHDLRSPLNSIRGFAEILARQTDGPLNAQQLESVHMIRESGDDLLRLVTDILDSARLEAGRLELHRQWVPPIELLTEAVNRALGAVGQDVSVDTEVSAGLPPVRVDGGRIVQALTSVLVHTLRGVQRGQLRIQASLSSPSSDDGESVAAPSLHIEITDPNGVVGPQARRRISAAFDERKRPAPQSVGGVDLGLGLARALVVEHGGDLWYRHEKFTALILRLPIDGPRSPAANARASNLAKYAEASE
ncbi:MAG: histidine kinase dimerization/phospho-acceptor domain-containing protein, partial [Myxococcota bacterium]